RTAIRNGGTIDKYIGDAIMVHFGTPVPQDDDAYRAMKCAFEMIAEIETWNEIRLAHGQFEINIGIGLHYGDAIAGNIGDENRLEYTVLGDAVNVASRLETMTRKLGTSLLVSDATIRNADRYKKSETFSQLTEGESISLKGRVHPVDIWLLNK
ncbi:MAG: adenylate/guanylate cyclase domain-containing protein, partial [Pseudomonadota bacterium]